MTLIEELESEYSRLHKKAKFEEDECLALSYRDNKDGFYWAVQIAREYSEWIPVNERLPKNDENVLAYSRDKEMFIAWCGVLGRTWRDSFRDAPYDELVGISITHWMPLPPPPSEVQNV